MTDDEPTDAEKSRMAGNLLRLGTNRKELQVETRRSRLPPGPTRVPRFEIELNRIDDEDAWCFFLVGNGHRVPLGEEWEHATAKTKAKTLEKMGMRVEWVRT